MGLITRRLLADESGQDLIEYGLLVGIVAAALVLIGPVLESSIARVFTGWGTSTNSLWVPNAPTTTP